MIVGHPVPHRGRTAVHRHSTEMHGAPQFFCHVVVADGIFEGQMELIAGQKSEELWIFGGGCGCVL